MNINKFPSWLEEDPLQKKAGNRTTAGNVVSSKEHLIVENFIKSNLPKVYTGSVKAVTRYQKEGDYPPALLIKTNSRFCMNIGREHNSCGVYFYVTPFGLTQKCLCSCNKMDGRRNGLCADYTSTIYKFDEITSDKLFPEKNMFEEHQKDQKDQKDQKSDKKMPKNKKKADEQDNVYKPQTKTNIEKEKKGMLDKLWNDIMG